MPDIGGERQLAVSKSYGTVTDRLRFSTSRTEQRFDNSPDSERAFPKFQWLLDRVTRALETRETKEADGTRHARLFRRQDNDSEHFSGRRRLFAGIA
jgi:hypothetical protein